jgi:hypothetical protein
VSENEVCECLVEACEECLRLANIIAALEAELQAANDALESELF